MSHLSLEGSNWHIVASWKWAILLHTVGMVPNPLTIGGKIVISNTQLHGPSLSWAGSTTRTKFAETTVST